MKFSVLIPLYNKGPYILTTINSVLAQTCGDFELIVVDDGSTDEGLALIAAISDPRVRFVCQANAGVSAARNLGISLARGEWVAFLDGDDWQHPLYLATLLKVQAAFPLADTVATDHIKIPHSDGAWPPPWPAIPENPKIELITDLAARWMSGQSLFTSSTAVRTTRLQSMQPCFEPGESYGEDLDLWFRLSEAAPIALARVPLSAYRVGVAESLTAHHTELRVSPFLQRMQTRALSGAMTPEQSRSALWLVAQQEITLSRQALIMGHRAESLRWLLKARRAVTGKRWWMTAAMAFLFPGKWARTWQLWRVNRTVHSLDTRDAG